MEKEIIFDMKERTMSIDEEVHTFDELITNNQIPPNVIPDLESQAMQLKQFINSNFPLASFASQFNVSIRMD